jgi:hypothetical protein
MHNMELLKYYIKNAEGMAKKVVVTADDVTNFMSDQTKQNEFAEFIHDRLFYRYINPFLYAPGIKVKKEVDTNGIAYEEYTLLYKNGFSLMANSCLLIETLESFYRGWGNTNGPNEIAFLKFFTRDSQFAKFAIDDMPSMFYKNIRCGILHQGETTGGWTLTRESSFLLNKNKKIINATKFLETLKNSLENYKTNLQTSDWNDDVWSNARKKIKAILKNTQSS